MQSLHRRHGHDLLAAGVVPLEHGVEQTLEVADFVGGVGGGELGDGVRGRVHEGVDAGAVVLGARAADLEVEGRDGVVAGRDIAIEVGVGDVVGKGLAVAVIWVFASS